MVSTYDVSDSGVSYDYEEFLYAEAGNDIDGFRWLLELPSEPDSTVKITDGDLTYEFTNVTDVNDVYRAVGPTLDDLSEEQINDVEVAEG